LLLLLGAVAGVDEAEAFEGARYEFDGGAGAVEIDNDAPTLDVTVVETSVFAAVAALAMPQVDLSISTIPNKPLVTNRESDFLLSMMSTSDGCSLRIDALWIGAGACLFAGVNAQAAVKMDTRRYATRRRGWIMVYKTLPNRDSRLQFA